MLEWHDYVKIFVAIMVIVDPIGGVPVFLTLTSGRSAVQRYRAAWVAALAVALVLLASALAGEHIMRLFGIGIPSFRVGAGIVILLMSISMLHGKLGATRQAPGEAEEAEEKDTVAVVPLAIPLLSGPGAISTTIVYSHQSSFWMHTLMLCVIILVVAVSVWVSLRLAVPIGRALGTTGVNIATRLMGLILAAIAVEFIAGGMKELFPALR
jgi:multiple antibiotic resistance protein